jgi:hypothetical protein
VTCGPSRSHLLSGALWGKEARFFFAFQNSERPEQQNYYVPTAIAKDLSLILPTIHRHRICLLNRSGGNLYERDRLSWSPDKFQYRISQGHSDSPTKAMLKKLVLLELIAVVTATIFQQTNNRGFDIRKACRIPFFACVESCHQFYTNAGNRLETTIFERGHFTYTRRSSSHV